MNHDETESNATRAKGPAQQAGDVLTGDEKLEAEGREREARGAREQIGTASRKVLEQVEDLGRKIQKRLSTGRT